MGAQEAVGLVRPVRGRGAVAVGVVVHGAHDGRAVGDVLPPGHELDLCFHGFDLVFAGFQRGRG